MAKLSKAVSVVFTISMLFLAIFNPVFKPMSSAAAQNPAFPVINESPLALKMDALAQLSIVNGSHSDEIAFNQAENFLDYSLDNDFWDNYHVKNAFTITGDLVVIKRLESTKIYKNSSDPCHGVLVTCIEYLVQSDRRLADISISDAMNASGHITDPLTLKLMNASISQAKKQQAMAEAYLERMDLDNAVEHYHVAWAQANIALLLADKKISPTVAITSPANGTYVNTPIINVSGFVDDVAVYSLGNVTLTVNGRQFVVPLSSGAFTQQVQLHEGMNSIKVTAIDLLNNKGTGSSQVILDTAKPAVTITGVSDGNYYNDSVRPIVTINDANPGSSSTVLDGTPYDGALVSDEGAHILRVDVIDLAGNTANATVNFVIDRTPPVALLYGIQNNNYLGRSVLVDGGIADANPGSLSLRIDGVEVSRQLPYLWNTSAYADGNHTIELLVTDKALNTGSSSVSVTVDNTPPTVKILVPANGYLSHSSLVKFLWSGSDNYGVSFYRLFLGDKLQDNTTGTSGTADNLPDGSYQASVEAHDLADNTANATVNFTIDTTPPSINITNIEEGAYYNYYVTPQVNVSDDNLNYTSMMLNGMAYNEGPIYDEGNYSLYVYAEDLAGNIANKTVNFTIDKTPPSLLVQELIDDPTLIRPWYNLTGNVSTDATLTVNGVEISHDEHFNYSTIVTEGVNNFIINVMDEAGNIATWNKTRLIDNDTLPDYYEINVTYTDPLKGDTDGNGISDDMEDPDNDGLNNLVEYIAGTDPLNNDTDSDGLPDLFEFEKSLTAPNNPDTDNNSVSDANEDPDNDGLTNIQEYHAGSNPLIPDTDTDGLNDSYELSIGTNPLNQDTDTDGINDSAELQLGTDPKSNDSNNNGIPDSREYYVQTYSNTTAGIEVTINSQGDIGKNLELRLDEYPSPLITNLSGVNKVVRVDSDANISWAIVKVYYDPATVTNTSALKLYRFNDTSNGMDLIDEQGINETGHYLWGNVSHFCDFIIADPSQWFNNWYSDWKKPDFVLAPGEQLEINVMVHNTGYSDATNVSVEFRENDTNGTFIGNTTIPQIVANSSGIASFTWKAEAYVDKIYINVDPDNLVVELNESNNSAYADLSKVLDSDGDGLTDYEEVHGMLIAWPNTVVKTKPNDRDSDGDGLSDGEEMGPIVQDDNNLVLYLQGKISNYDGYHYQYLSNPNNWDSDNDGLIDPAENDLGTKPFNSDSDNDCLSDIFEVDTLLTDPLYHDTDYDGFGDYKEWSYGKVDENYPANLITPSVIQVPMDVVKYLLSDNYKTYIITHDPLYHDTVSMTKLQVAQEFFLGYASGPWMLKGHENGAYIQGWEQSEKLPFISIITIYREKYGFENIGDYNSAEKYNMAINEFWAAFLASGGLEGLGYEDLAAGDAAAAKAAVIRDTEIAVGKSSESAVAFAERALRDEGMHWTSSDAPLLLDTAYKGYPSAIERLEGRGLKDETLMAIDKEGINLGLLEKASADKSLFEKCPKLAENLNEIFTTDKYPVEKEYLTAQFKEINSIQKRIDIELNKPYSARDEQLISTLSRKLDSKCFNKVKGVDGSFRLGNDIGKIYPNNGYEEVISFSKANDAKGPDGYRQLTGTLEGTIGVTGEAKEATSVSRSTFSKYVIYDDNGNPIGFDVNRVISAMAQALKKDAQNKGTPISDSRARELAENYWKNPNQKYLIGLYGPNGGALKNSLRWDGAEVPYEFVSTRGDKITGTVRIKVVAPDCEVL